MKNTDDEVFLYSEQRRHDPELLAKVEQLHNARNAALLSAAKKLQEIKDDLWGLRIFQHDDIYSRCEDAVWMASSRVGRDAEFMQGIGGECYNGNLAAGRLGYQIEQMGEDFYKYLPRLERGED